MATASVSASVLEFMGWLTDYMLKASWSTLTAWAPATPKVTWTWTLIPTHHHVPNAPNTPDQVRELCAEVVNLAAPGPRWDTDHSQRVPLFLKFDLILISEYRLLPHFCPPLIGSTLRLSGESNLRHLDVSTQIWDSREKRPSPTQWLVCLKWLCSLWYCPLLSVTQSKPL